MKLTLSSLIISTLALAGYGCGSGAPVPPPAAPLSSPIALCTDGSADCVEPARVERWLSREPFEILGVAETSGSSGAKLLTLATHGSEGRRVFRAKWREHEGSLLNDARKEIVAYRTQQLFLLPHEYVVPPTTGRCLDLKTYRAHLDREAEASFEGTSCVFGSLSYWLENVKGSEPFSSDRFAHDVEYRRAMADVNTFTFVIQHGDTHDKNFLMTKEEESAQARVYSPDNAIAFSPYFRNPVEHFRRNWYDLRVPALRAAVVDRLRHLERKDVSALSVVEQYRIERGALIPTKLGAPIGDSGVRRAGKTLQLGLTPEESERLFERVQLLLSKVRSGEVEVF
ncbi:MAG TPA: hypothetical protein VFU02_06325 [Polyangiaceae bacterium]|nr:hypothetical protein [Polyangiaceae bacterium]